MLGDSVTWRAIVEEPDTDWSALATLIAAGTSSQANALEKITYGLLEEDSGHADYVAPPRIVLRLPDSGDMDRLSTSGFTSSVTIVCTIEIPVPEDYVASFRDAYIDATNKIGGIIRDVQRLGRVAGYLDIARLQLGPLGLMDPDQNNGEQWMGVELLVEAKGSLP